MKVFVAGATGAIGRPLVSALIAAGNEVLGMTSRRGGLDVLRAMGADGAIADALDARAVDSVLKKFRPHAVVEELTSLPKNYTPADMRAAAERDRRLRLEGGRNVQNAATAYGARRYVVQSTGFFYAPGPGRAAESEPLAVAASPEVSASVRTYMQVEERVLGSSEIIGTALRYGFFYGPGTYHADDGSISSQVRAGQYPVVGSGDGVFSFVHVEDAAMATLAALKCAPGVYNVVDDYPSAMKIWLPAFARYLGAPEPPRISQEEVLETAGPDAVYYAMQLRGADNTRAKKELGFRPRILEWLERSK
jgi:nucleoside-diphosphate-sugar epimerase